MKRRLLIPLATVAMAGLGVPTAAASANCGHPFAAGHFRSTEGLSSAFLEVNFSARFVSGEAVGTVRERLVWSGGPTSTSRGEVTCLTVSGNTAAVGFVVVESTGGNLLPTGATQVLLVRDDPAGDHYAFAGTDDCDTAIGIAPGAPIASGDIRVRS